MRINTKTVWDMSGDELVIIENESYEYDGSVTEAKGGGNSQFFDSDRTLAGSGLNAPSDYTSWAENMGASSNYSTPINYTPSTTGYPTAPPGTSTPPPGTSTPPPGGDGLYDNPGGQSGPNYGDDLGGYIKYVNSYGQPNIWDTLGPGYDKIGDMFYPPSDMMTYQQWQDYQGSDEQFKNSMMRGLGSLLGNFHGVALFGSGQYGTDPEGSGGL